MAGEDYRIGATLDLRGLAAFKAGMAQAGRSVDDIGDEAKGSSAALAAMNTVGRGVGRTMATSLKYGAMGAGAGLAIMTGAAIKGAVEAERVGAQTLAVIESTRGVANTSAREVDRLSTGIMKYSGINDEALGSAQNLLLTFKQIRDEKGPQNTFARTTKLAADMSTALGTEVTGSAMQLGKALNDPVAGMARLSRSGVTFTEQQKKVVEGLMETGRVSKAQGIILNEVASEFGGSARAMGKTAEGQFNVFKETVGNALEKIGAGLLPLATKILPDLSKMLVDVFESIGPALGIVIKALSKSLGPVLKAIAPALKTLGKLFAEIATALAPVLALLGRVFSKVLKELMPALKPLIAELGRAFLQALKAIAPELPKIARSLAEILVEVTPLIPLFAKVSVMFLKVAGPVLTKLIQGLVWLVKKGIKPVKDFMSIFAMSWGEIWADIKGVASGVWQALRRGWDNLIGFFTGLPGRVGRALKGIWNGLVSGFKGVLNGIINLWNNFSLTVNIPDAIPGLPSEWTLNTPNLPTFARGGVPPLHRPVLVGEGGAELVQFNRRARIIPAEKTDKLLTRAAGAVATAGPAGSAVGPGRPLVVQLVLPDGRILAEEVIDQVRAMAARL